MMQTGFNIGTDETSKIETELINIIQSKMNERKMKEQEKIRQRMNGGRR